MFKKTIILFLSVFTLNSQNRYIDSIKQVLSKNPHDTIKIICLNNIAWELLYDNTDSALFYAHQALAFSKKNNGVYFLNKTFHHLGTIYFQKSNNDSAIFYFKLMLNHPETKRFPRQLAVANIGLGNVFNTIGEYEKSLAYYFNALKIFERMKEENGLGMIYGNIANVYFHLSDYDNALKYSERSLSISSKLNDLYGVVSSYNNIGNIYITFDNKDKALKNYLLALKINEKLKNKILFADLYNNIGLIYKNLNQLDLALDYYSKSIKYYQETDNPYGISNTSAAIGDIYLMKKNKNMALKYYFKSININKENHFVELQKKVLEKISNFYIALGDYKKAYACLLESMRLNDSIFSEQNRKASKELIVKYETEKKEKEIELQKEKINNQEIKINHQRRMQSLSLLGIFMLLIMSVLAYWGYKQKKKNNEITERRNYELQMLNIEIEHQKSIIEQKQNETLESIRYAKRIQTAILPSTSKFKKYFQNYFILYMPKDIIAGDFYWLESNHKYIYVAVADCTGHGVPGAMVSVICSNALTQAVLEEKIIDTDTILNRVREIVIDKLAGEENMRDGMDICLIRIENNSHKLQYSGANRSLYIVTPAAEYLTEESANKGVEATDSGELDTHHFLTTTELIELKPDKQPIGRYEEMKPFTKQEIVAHKNSMVYLTTDGYADQFGGTKGKKLGTKLFKELLKENSIFNNPEHQREHVYNQFLTWKNKEEQIDDITLIGIRII
jgi:tetratricopeptide (TPR) repeat protein